MQPSWSPPQMQQMQQVPAWGYQGPQMQHAPDWGGRPGPAVSTSVCKHFLVGKCNVADCRFSHDTGPAASTSVCKHFLAGKCNVADCRFSHATNVEGAGVSPL